jgi:hypothetical protein
MTSKRRDSSNSKHAMEPRSRQTTRANSNRSSSGSFACSCFIRAPCVCC